MWTSQMFPTSGQVFSLIKKNVAGNVIMDTTCKYFYTFYMKAFDMSKQQASKTPKSWKKLESYYESKFSA